MVYIYFFLHTAKDLRVTCWSLCWLPRYRLMSNWSEKLIAPKLVSFNGKLSLEKQLHPIIYYYNVPGEAFGFFGDTPY